MNEMRKAFEIMEAYHDFYKIREELSENSYDEEFGLRLMKYFIKKYDLKTKLDGSVVGTFVLVKNELADRIINFEKEEI